MFARKAFAIAGAAALALTMGACGSKDNGGSSSASGSTGGELKIGIAMPQKTSQNWVEAEQMFKDDCKAKKLDCTIQFANGGVTEQQNQISAMITSGVKVLLIGAIDGSQLGTQIAEAKQAGIKVVSYDRLLTNTKDQDYYIAYDSYNVGELQGQALIDGLKKLKGNGPWKVEIIAGSADDANSLKFYNGAMSKLKPLIDEGKIVVPSGQTEFQQASTQGWDPKNAQNRMDAILVSSYKGSEGPDGILSPNDTLARAALTSIKNANKPLPVVTGQDSEDESVTLVAKGEQYSTIYKDTRALVKDAVTLAEELAKGEEPKLEGVTFNDKDYLAMPGVPVKSFLLKPIIVTKDNCAEVYKNDPVRSKLVAAVQGK